MARPNSESAIGGHVQGLREAKAAFQALPEAMRDRSLQATETTSSEIARGAQARLLRSPSVETRALHDHVAWKVTKTNGRGKVGIRAGTTTITVGTRKIRVKGIITAGRDGSASLSAGARKDNPARRAHFIEFGARHMRAEPFMIPAAEAEKGPHLDRMKRAGKAVEQDLAKIGGGRL